MENKEETTNYARATRIIAHLEGIYRDFASVIIDPTTVSVNRSMKLTAQQTDIVKKIATVKHYDNCDFSLLYIILRSQQSMARPTNGWGRAPSPTAVNLFDDMERVREMKDSLSHNPGYRITTAAYNALLNEAQEICRRIDSNKAYLLPDTYEHKLIELRTWSTTNVSEEPVSRKILDYVANHIAGEWKRLGRLLGIEEHKISQIDNDNNKTYEKAIQCLVYWLQAHGKEAVWPQLSQALSEMQRQDIIDEVEEKFIIKPSTSANLITFVSKHKFTVDTFRRLDSSDDHLKNPKVYDCTMYDGPMGVEIPVAVKLFNVDSEEHRTELKENATLLFELRQHPKCDNVVNIIDFKEHNGNIFMLVIEKGNFDLSQYLGLSPVSEEVNEEIAKTKERVTPQDIARGILNGLEFVHSNRQGGTVMHRDIKPANILCKVDDQKVTLKISDFGISKKSIFSRNTTTTNLHKGTDLYIPADIREKRDSNERQIEIVDLQMADMFAVGVTLHQVLTGGRHPFQGKNETRTSVNIEDGDRKELLKLNDTAVLNLIYNLTEANPKHRLSALEAKKHPWFFTPDNIIELLKQLNIALLDTNISIEQKLKFEEDRKYAFCCKRWDSFIPWNFLEELNKIESESFTIIYNDFVRDFIKFILKVVSTSSETEYSDGMCEVFGCKSPSNGVILNRLLVGADCIFPSALMYVYCKAAEVFPQLEVFSKDNVCADASQKIAYSYRGYLEHVSLSSNETCTLFTDLSALSLEDAEKQYEGGQ